MSWFLEFAAPDKAAAEARLCAEVTRLGLPHTVGLFISHAIDGLEDGVEGAVYVRSAGHIATKDPWNGGSQHTEVRRLPAALRGD